MARERIFSILLTLLVLASIITIAQTASGPQELVRASSVILSPLDSPLPPPVACSPSTGLDVPVLQVTIGGLLEGSAAELQLIPSSAETTVCLSEHEVALPQLAVQNGTYAMNIPAIPDGSYRLTLSAPVGYFRDPEAYFFQVYESQIIRFSEIPFHFQLVPPSDQRLPPCRELDGQPDSESFPGQALLESPAVCRAERTIALSIPPKEPESQGQENGGMLNAGYHYAGPRTFQDNTGVWGRNYVVDPGVAHPHSGPTQFVCERVYANNGSNWMEAGWVEHSGLDDRQYVYEYDSATHSWNFFVGQFSLSPGTPVETRVRYDSSISQWVAELWWNGAWRELASESLGFVTADMGYSRGEIYTADGNHPVLPVSSFDRGYLRVGGIWTVWDWRWNSDVAGNTPYECDMMKEYYWFNIHSPAVFLPLVVKD